MAFTAKDVQSLREKTGCGMMDCKKALTETDGNMDKAIDFLREKGLAAAAKKAGRIAAEGLVDCYVEGNIGVIAEVNSETDFVAKNDDFKAFVKGCAITAAKNNPADVAALLDMKFEGSKYTVAEMLHEKILTIGENIKVRRFARVQGNIITYVHGGGRIGVLVDFDTDTQTAAKSEFVEMGRNLCMQIAAMSPLYLNREAVPAEVIEGEKNILIAQIKNDEKNKNKPDAIVEKMVQGKIGKYFDTNCLLEQSFVKDAEIKVAKYVENTAKDLGVNLTVKSFVRYEKGEGLQKREDNFADEVANMIK